MPDHVHMMISIPPKYSVAQVVGYIKGKSAIHLARVYAERKRNSVGQHFWAVETAIPAKRGLAENQMKGKSFSEVIWGEMVGPPGL